MRRVVLVPFILLLTVASHAGILTGTASITDPGGNLFGPPAQIQGVLDVSGGMMQVFPSVILSPFGPVEVTTGPLELLGPGDYIRPDGFGGTLFATVGQGQFGSYMHLFVSLGGQPMNLIPTFMVWDVTSTPAGDLYTPVDSDGDGIPGHRVVVPPFPGFTLAYTFTVLSGPSVSVAVAVEGGARQECSETGGSTVTATASVTLTDGAELATLTWDVDGAAAGSGDAIHPFLTLGHHTITVTAETIGGASSTHSAEVDVVDTTPPELEVSFVDPRTGSTITEAGRHRAEHVVTRIRAIDVCDAEPTVEAVGGFDVADGDRLKVKGEKGSVVLTTTTLTLSATAADASRNLARGGATLTLLADGLEDDDD